MLQTTQNTFPVRQLHMDGNLATMVCGPIAVVVWRGIADMFGNLKVQEAGIQAFRHSPNGIGVVGVVESTHKVPDAETRADAARINDRLFSFGAVGFAGVLPLPGFAGAWARGVVTGISLLARARYPFNVYQHEGAALAWLADLLQKKAKVSCDAKACTREIEAFRQEYEDYWKSVRNMPGVSRPPI